MARFDVGGIDELIQDMNLEEERIDHNGPAAAMAGAKVAIVAMEATVPVRTGGLKGHIQARGPFYDSVDGHHADVFPTGKDPHGERYETIGAVQEYGRSDMPAQPWMRPAVETHGDAIGAAVAETLMRD
ncbi:MAG: hypothetical protein IKK75_13965 [Clostridia bacterium]|nr:hypothetical protein [Clostridia bacterium]